MDGLFRAIQPLFTLLLVLLVVHNAHCVRTEEMRCERITVAMCREVKYNMTSMPNRFHHETQEEAGLEVHQFFPLVKIGCSPLLKEFLCSAYFPICMENYPKPIIPCRSLCQQVRNGCERLMTANGFPWPENLECNLFPEVGDDNNLCLDLPAPGPAVTEARKFHEPPTTTLPPAPVKPIKSTDPCSCSCPNQNLLSTDPMAGNFAKILGCLPSCYSGLVERGDRAAVSWWIGAWTVLSVICSVFLLLTFLIDRHRFNYPERPIIIIAFCYLMVSLGFGSRMVLGHEYVSCDGIASLQGVNSFAPCVVTFVLLYFFGMASFSWWVVLSLTWYLTARFRWSPEAIAERSSKLHLFAWLFPFIQTIAVIGLSAVDGDPVAGVCYVGVHSLQNLVIFVIVPIAVYLALGILFLLLGLFSIMRIRQAIELQSGHIDKEKLRRLIGQRRRIGLYGFLTVVPHATLLACHLYELRYREQWDRSVSCRCQEKSSEPYLMVFMMKYLCMMVIGITSCLWLIGRKTVEAWKRVLCNGCNQPPSPSSKSSDIGLLAPYRVAIPGCHKSPYPISNV